MKLLSITIALFAVLSPVAFAQVTQPPTILISEIQLGSATSATEEFVEIINQSSVPTNLTGVSLEYKSKSGTNWSVKAKLDGEIGPYGRFLISNYLDEVSQEFNGGLAGSAGHLRLAWQDETLDLIGWGEASEPLGDASETHGDGQSLKRFVDEDGRFVDTNNNHQDWFVSKSPTPEFDIWPLAAADEPTNEDPAIIDDPIVTVPLPIDPDLDEPDSTIIAPRSSAAIIITELLPDPISPQKDAEHEFIELYNPNTFAVELVGYKLVSGEGRYSHIIGEYLLQPDEYIGLLSADTNLTLSNSGTVVTLTGPDGTLLDEIEYPKAKPGLSWSKFSESWEWAPPTINAKNLHLENQNAEVLAAEAVNSSLVEKKEIEFAQPKSSNSTIPPTTGQLVEIEDEPRTVNNWVLAGVGGLTVLYAIYEYRKDIRIRIQQLRRYFAVRRENRQSSSGR